MKLFGVQIWPWKYSTRLYSIRWSFVRNGNGGLSFVINHHLWYTVDPNHKQRSIWDDE